MSARILLAEDEEHIARLVLFKLGKAEYVCDWAKNGAEALEKLRVGDWDLLILDVMMPVLDGWSVLREMPNLGLARMPRVIMLSARGFERDLGVAAQLGVQHYLRKPFDPAELLTLVQKVLHE